LKSIGSQKDRAYLLESLLNPIAQDRPRLRPRFHHLERWQESSRHLDKEDKKQIVLRMADGKTRPSPAIKSPPRPPPISVMPPMLGILTKPQIRDVVAYLFPASLKGKTSKKK
jgi:quinoprotein glucose dehydrogenase